jgi:hypothetical protein
MKVTSLRKGVRTERKRMIENEGIRRRNKQKKSIAYIENKKSMETSQEGRSSDQQTCFPYYL